MARPSKPAGEKRRKISVAVAPETAAGLERLSEEKKLSTGKIIDELYTENEQRIRRTLRAR